MARRPPKDASSSLGRKGAGIFVPRTVRPCLAPLVFGVGGQAHKRPGDSSKQPENKTKALASERGAPDGLPPGTREPLRGRSMVRQDHLYTPARSRGRPGAFSTSPRRARQEPSGADAPGRTSNGRPGVPSIQPTRFPAPRKFGLPGRPPRPPRRPERLIYRRTPWAPWQGS